MTEVTLPADGFEVGKLSIQAKSHQQQTVELIASVDTSLSNVSKLFSNISTDLFAKLGDIEKRIEAIEVTLNAQVQEERNAKLK